MGWLLFVDTKLQVSFAEYCLFYRALLQKRPEILSGEASQDRSVDSLVSIYMCRECQEPTSLLLALSSCLHTRVHIYP